MLGFSLLVPYFGKINDYSSKEIIQIDKIDLPYLQMKCGEIRDVYGEKLNNNFKVQRFHIYTSLFNRYDRHAILNIELNNSSSFFFDPTFGLIAKNDSNYLSFTELRKSIIYNKSYQFEKIFDTNYDIKEYYINYDHLILNSLIEKHYKLPFVKFHFGLYFFNFNGVYLWHEILIYYLIIVLIIYLFILIVFNYKYKIFNRSN